MKKKLLLVAMTFFYSEIFAATISKEFLLKDGSFEKEVCEDFSGTWEGSCQNLTDKIDVVRIQQNVCSQIKIDETVYPIEGKIEIKKTFLNKSIKEYISSSWNENKTEISFLKTFEIFPIGNREDKNLKEIILSEKELFKIKDGVLIIESIKNNMIEGEKSSKTCFYKKGQSKRHKAF